MSSLNIKTESCEDTVHILYFSVHLESQPTVWETLCGQINSSIKSLSNGYLWHKEDLKVCLPILNTEIDTPVHLMSSTSFGDNIEDEWFIVYLIMEISKQFKDLIIQILDNDGNFLLIEAASYLPSWANPESTENRVFIFNGNIHLISPTMAEINSKLSFKDALHLIAQNPKDTIATTEIQNAILSRIQKYPENMKEHYQKTIVKLPLEIASLLTVKPSFISAIVESYCNHDMFDSKYCRNMNFDDYVYVEVNFTKCLYAMLMHAKPFRNNEYRSSVKKDKCYDLGLKLTYGFQILMNKLTKDVFSTKEFSKYINNLRGNGYFRANIEDSKEYKHLLLNAKKYFIDMECPISMHICNSISEVMSTDEFIKVKEKLQNSKVTKEDLVEDSDDWLNVNPNQLNDLLNSRYGEPVKFEKDDIITPEAITSKLTDFLKKSSDFEGIETKEESEDNNCIQFDSNEFVDCLEKMMNLLSDNKDPNFDSDSDVDYDSDISDNKEDNLIDREVASKLNSTLIKEADSKTVFLNFTQSMKEEGLCGPSSNLFKTIGMNKTDMLDSDDE